MWKLTVDVRHCALLHADGLAIILWSLFVAVFGDRLFTVGQTKGSLLSVITGTVGAAVGVHQLLHHDALARLLHVEHFHFHHLAFCAFAEFHYRQGTGDFTAATAARRCAVFIGQKFCLLVAELFLKHVADTHSTASGVNALSDVFKRLWTWFGCRVLTVVVIILFLHTFFISRGSR